MCSFHIPIEKAEEIIPRLAKQKVHWKKGRSAFELSNAWMQVGGLFYQLVHRTCASIYEAKRFGHRRAVTLVHSFDESRALSKSPACFDDFHAFSGAVGMLVVRPGFISPPKVCEGIEVRLAWVSDKPSS